MCSSDLTDTKDIKFTSTNPCRLINILKEETGKDIWICGGADIINQLMKEDLIDIFHISIIPTILGGGIKLFEEIDNMINLSLINTLDYNGVIEAVYKRR